MTGSHTVDVDGVAIHVEEEGAGPTVVLLHGFTGSGSTMADLGSRLGAVRQLRPHLVGHGKSAAPVDVAEYSMQATVRQIASTIELFSERPVDVVGYSFGGRVALSLLAARPELVRRAAVIGATPGITTARARFDRMTADGELANSIESEGLEAFVDKWMALDMWDSLRHAVGPEAWAASREQRLEGTAIGYTNSLRGAGAGAMPPVHEELEQRQHPVAIIAGQRDTKFMREGRNLNDIMTNSRFSMIEAVGHAAHLERPDVVATKIVECFS
jgi:2-succinyl-6-hydroxy-2,4-cyclohexadiene-1-carboxylate synthase